MKPIRPSPAAARSGTGFTLIEVMIVVVIVAILAAIAVPAYQNSIRKSRRADATTAISRVQLAQEKWRANHTTYATALSDLGLSANSEGGYYTIAITAPTAGSPSGTTYTITATPVSGKSQEKDTGCDTSTPITLTQSGSTTTYTPATCWGR